MHYRKRFFAALILAAVLLPYLPGCGIRATEPTQVTVDYVLPTQTTPVTEPTTEPVTEPTEPPITKLSTATVGAVGDVLLHDQVIRSGHDEASGSYNFDDAFRFFTAYASAVDYAVANLEVTLCGDDNGYPYKGYPCFNAPDAIVDALQAAGFDMLLTANNHCYDTQHTGLIRTQQTILDKGLDYTGTRLTEGDPNYLIRDINGIRIGMICYTYNTSQTDSGTVSLNGMQLSAADSRLVNSFSYHRLEEFYEKLAAELSAMKAQGAEATMLFIHWGDEYQTTPNGYQQQIAQQLCDLGVDVIVGNHAHVIQPVQLLTNTSDETKKALCLYSTGNILSNIFGSKYPKHTEDGMLFQVTFAKYSDGTVLLQEAQIIPTWLYRGRDPATWKRTYTILPLAGTQEQWQAELNLDEALLQGCLDSYGRTEAIVSAGLAEANAWLAHNQASIEQQLGVTE